MVRKWINKLRCYLFGHRINVCMIEHSNEKTCARCDKTVWCGWIYTVDDYLEEFGHTKAGEL